MLGLEVAPQRSILVSTAHDEPAIRLEIFKDVFTPAGGALLPDRERAAVRAGAVPDRPLLEDVVGVGVDLPQQQPYPRMPDVRRRTTRRDPPTRRRRGARPRANSRRICTARGAVFRRRHRLYGPIVLYGGRIDPGKGCEELIEYFSTT